MPLTAADIAKLNKLGTPELRALALAQLQGARQALDAGRNATNDISWWQQPLKFNQYVRWAPESRALDDAEKIISVGDSEPDDRSKRARYAEAYRQTYTTAESIAKEAKLPPTNFTTQVLEPTASKAVEYLDEAKKQLQEPLSNLANVATVAGVAWLLYRLVKK